MTSTMRYFFAASADGVLHLDVLDDIGSSLFGDGVTSRDVSAKLAANRDAKHIHVQINSGGGDAFEGIATYNLLKEHPAHVRVEVLGLAASAASLIAMAGDEIVMRAGAMMMIHDPSGVAMGGADDFRRHASALDTLTTQFADIYASRTKQVRPNILRMMRDETWMDGPTAVRLGFATACAQGAEARLGGLNLAACARVPQRFAQAVASARMEVCATGKPNARAYLAMRPVERAALKRAQPELYAQLREQAADIEARPWAHGASYADLRPVQRAAWFRADPVAARAARDTWQAAGGGLR